MLDIVGTGGDDIGSVNISTGACILAATAGAVVAKHGNRYGLKVATAAVVSSWPQVFRTSDAIVNGQCQRKHQSVAFEGYRRRLRACHNHWCATAACQACSAYSVSSGCLVFGRRLHHMLHPTQQAAQSKLTGARGVCLWKAALWQMFLSLLLSFPVHAGFCQMLAANTLLAQHSSLWYYAHQVGE